MQDSLQSRVRAAGSANFNSPGFLKKFFRANSFLSLRIFFWFAVSFISLPHDDAVQQSHEGQESENHGPPERELRGYGDQAGEEEDLFVGHDFSFFGGSDGFHCSGNDQFATGNGIVVRNFT